MVLDGHKDIVSGVTFSPDGSLLASSNEGTDSKVIVRQFPSGTILRSLATRRPGDHSINVLAFGYDGKRLAIGTTDGVIEVWDATNGELTTTLSCKPSVITAIVFSRDGRTLFSADVYLKARVRRWTIETGADEIILSQPESSGEFAIAPDERTFVVGTLVGPMLWSMAQHDSPLMIGKQPDGICALAYSLDSRSFASTTRTPTMKIWDVTTRKEKATIHVDGEDISAIAFSPVDKSLLAAACDRIGVTPGYITLWDVDSQRQLVRRKAAKLYVTALAFSPDGKWLAVGAYDGTVKIWNVDKLLKAGVPKGN